MWLTQKNIRKKVRRVKEVPLPLFSFSDSTYFASMNFPLTAVTTTFAQLGDRWEVLKAERQLKKLL